MKYLLDEIEPLADEQRLLMILVVEIYVGDAELELQMGRDVGRGFRLDDSIPYNRADALRAHHHADHQAAVGLELARCCPRARSRGFSA